MHHCDHRLPNIRHWTVRSNEHRTTKERQFQTNWTIRLWVKKNLVFWIGGRLWEVIAYGGSSIGHMYSYRADQYFLPQFTLSWIIQTDKCTMIHTRLNKKRPPFLFRNKKETRCFKLNFLIPWINAFEHLKKLLNWDKSSYLSNHTVLMHRKV